ncbi:MAG: hypothetical protein ABR962_02950 [Candidatus Bathyarchaeia archaeon]|jgi:vacuolar-type H+-ATPase subunit I/STV1
MVEISWGKALGYGVRYIAYIILWAIIGGLIVAGGAITIVASANIKYDSTSQTFDTSGMNLGGVILGVIIIVIGEILIILGAIASYFKLMARLITETDTSMPPRPPP